MLPCCIPVWQGYLQIYSIYVEKILPLQPPNKFETFKVPGTFLSKKIYLCIAF